MLAKLPKDCTEAEKEAVRFFFQQVLAVVDANIPKTQIWVGNNTYLKVLGGDWHFAMATGCVLLAEYADVTNIIYNLDETNKPNNTDDNSTGASSDDCQKRKRAMIHTKTNRSGLYKKNHQLDSKIQK